MMAGKAHIFSRFANLVSEGAGKPVTFILALVAVLIWAGLGPVFDYSETWQLVINTGTTIVTFLMVFVLQNAQTRDTRAIQAKLDEIILTSHAENRFIGIEHLDEEDLKHLDRIVSKAAAGQAKVREATDDDENRKPASKTQNTPSRTKNAKAGKGQPAGKTRRTKRSAATS